MLVLFIYWLSWKLTWLNVGLKGVKRVFCFVFFFDRVVCWSAVHFKKSVF